MRYMQSVPLTALATLIMQTVCIMQLMLVLQCLWGQQQSAEIMKFVAHGPLLATKESALYTVKLAHLKDCKAH
jgi:hypothetical protein